MTDYKKPDYWQLKARKEGYPARSVYKLMEIDEKFGFFNKTPIRALDLGAAPGSWSLYALRKMGGKGFLAACDLAPLSPDFDNNLKNHGILNRENFLFFQGDFTAAKTRETLSEKGPYSIIMSDAAPATTGNHTVDAARSLNLAEEVIGYAENTLAAGGNLAVKVFQSGDSAALLKQIGKLFKTVKTYKPRACRGSSVETYYIGIERLNRT